jgi:hypothetical protein
LRWQRHRNPTYLETNSGVSPVLPESLGEKKNDFGVKLFNDKQNKLTKQVTSGSYFLLNSDLKYNELCYRPINASEYFKIALGDTKYYIL